MGERLSSVRCSKLSHETKASLYLGIDCGGSKSQLVVVNKDCQAVAECRGEGCNYSVLGLENTVQRIVSLLQMLITSSNFDVSDIAGAFLGIAGIRSSSADSRQLAAALQTALSIDFVVENDTHIAWYAGTAGQSGIVIISGTGSNGYAIDDLGQRHQIGGWGWRLGDEGSGYAIGLAALRHATLAYEGRAPATSLSQALCSFYSITSVDELVGRIDSYQQIAAFAKVVHQQALSHDGVAQVIIQQAAQDLFVLVRWLVEHGDFSGENIPVVGYGGCFSHMTLLRHELVGCLKRYNETLTFFLPDCSAAFAAAKLALVKFCQ